MDAILASSFYSFCGAGVVLGPVEPAVKAVFRNANARSDVQDPKRRVSIDEFIGCRPADIEDVADVFDGVRGGVCGVHVVRSFVFWCNAVHLRPVQYYREKGIYFHKAKTTKQNSRNRKFILINNAE
jgi:hypothetical protein